MHQTTWARVSSPKTNARRRATNRAHQAGRARLRARLRARRMMALAKTPQPSFTRTTEDANSSRGARNGAATRSVITSTIKASKNRSLPKRPVRGHAAYAQTRARDSTPSTDAYQSGIVFDSGVSLLDISANGEEMTFLAVPADIPFPHPALLGAISK